MPYGDYINATDIDDGLLLEIELLDFMYSKGEKPPAKRITAVSEELLKLAPISVDTKQDMQEVYSNVANSHVRFRNECELGGKNLIVLTEQAHIDSLDDVARWQNPRVGKWYKVYNAHKKGQMLGVKIYKSPPMASPALAKAMQTMTDKYGVEWQFCDKTQTGKRIVEILGGG